MDVQLSVGKLRTASEPTQDSGNLNSTKATNDLEQVTNIAEIPTYLEDPLEIYISYYLLFSMV